MQKILIDKIIIFLLTIGFAIVNINSIKADNQVPILSENEELGFGVFIHQSKRFGVFTFDNYGDFDYHCDNASIYASYENFFGEFIGYRQIRTENIHVPAQNYQMTYQGGEELTEVLETIYDTPRIVYLDLPSLQVNNCKRKLPNLSQGYFDYYDTEEGERILLGINFYDNVAPDEILFWQNTADNETVRFQWLKHPDTSVRVEYRRNTTSRWTHVTTFDASTPEKIALCLSYSGSHYSPDYCRSFPRIYSGKIYYRFLVEYDNSVGNWQYIKPIGLFYDS